MIKKSEREWREQLSPEAYRVTRLAGTERPYSGAYYKEERAGVYHCVCCEAPIFRSDTKFDAGCGWPSFWAPLEGAKLLEVADHSHGMSRVEVRCARCDAHLGHVFEDGPQPTGLRYCINSASLDFEDKNK